MLNSSPNLVSHAWTEGEVAKDPQFAYTLAKGLEVLRAFDAVTPALGNREIAQRTGIGHRPTNITAPQALVRHG